MLIAASATTVTPGMEPSALILTSAWWKNHYAMHKLPVKTKKEDSYALAMKVTMALAKFAKVSYKALIQISTLFQVQQQKKVSVAVTMLNIKCYLLRVLA